MKEVKDDIYRDKQSHLEEIDEFIMDNKNDWLKGWNTFIWSAPFKIMAIYMVVGSLWILFSDKLVGLMIHNQETIIWVSILKGWAYVLITGIMIFMLIVNDHTKIRRTQEKLIDSYVQISKDRDDIVAIYEELAASEEELKNNYDTLIESQHALCMSEERYRLAVEGSSDGIWDWDIMTDVADISMSWADILGIEGHISGYKNKWLSLIHPEDISRVSEYFEDQLNDADLDFYRDEYRLKTKNGGYIWVYSRGKVLRSKMGEPIRIAGSHTDITERMNIQAKFENLAHYDDLTGLYNRIMLRFLLEIEIGKASASKQKFALLLLGLDNFKSINDTYGHEFGDRFLKKTAEKLREIESERCIIARFGGSKFGIIIKSIEEKADVLDCIKKVIGMFANEWSIDEKQILPALSIGIAMYPDHGADANELLRNGDMAMYKAKENVNSSYCFFENAFYLNLLKKIDTERRLRLAIMRDELILYYQPQLLLKSQTISGVEALVRWMDPEKGMISPSEFIPIAEDTGLIIDLGYWVLRAACKQVKNFQSNLNTDIKMSVNVSSIQLRDPSFVNQIRAIIEEEKVEAESIILEITESVIINNFEENRKILNDLRELGFKIALDDFGTGYSSLSYLNQIPIDEVKIDQLFVRDLLRDKHKMVVVDMIIELSHKLGFEVTAEGVESETELKYLKDKNCDRIQGYLLSKPYAPEDIIDRFKCGLDSQILDIMS